MPSTSVKDRVKHLEKSGAAPLLSPEEIEQRKRMEEAQRKNAIRIAKARASRYNMTLRSMTIQSAVRQNKQNVHDAKKIQQTRAAAAKYNATSRNLSIAVPRKAYTHIQSALDADVNPTTAKTLVELVASHVAETDVDDEEEFTKEDQPIIMSQSDEQEVSEARKSIKAHKSVSFKDEGAQQEPVPEKRKSSIFNLFRRKSSIKSQASTARKSIKSVKSEASVVQDDDDASEEAPSSRASSVVLSQAGDNFYMKDLAEAIKSGDDNDVNRAILKEFFEEHDPSRLGEIDELLAANKGREALLFTELTEEYPDPGEEFSVGGGSFLETGVSFAEAPSGGIEQTKSRKAKAKSSKKLRPLGEDASMTGATNALELSEKKNEQLEEQVQEYSKKASSATLERRKKSIKSMPKAQKSARTSTKSTARESSKSVARNSTKSQRKASVKSTRSASVKSTRTASVKSTRTASVKSTTKRTSSRKPSKQASGSFVVADDDDDDANSLVMDNDELDEEAAAPIPRKSLAHEGFIISGVQTPAENNTFKWAVNVQARLLKERMLRMGASEAAIEQIQAEDSGML